MVKYRDEPLDRTFAALSDPTRRALLARLGGQERLSVSELAAPFPVSLPAIMKHLDVLTDAGLIMREKTGRTVACRLTAQPMEQAVNWLNRYAQFWSDNLDRLAAFVEEETWPTQPSTPTPYSRPAKPYAHAPAPRAAGKSLRRLDASRAADAMVRAAEHEAGDAECGARRPHRRPLSHQLHPR